MTNDDITRSDLLDRYLAGELDAAGRTRVEAWLAAHPARSEILAALRARLGAQFYRPDVDGAWHRVRARIEAGPGAERSLSAPRVVDARIEGDTVAAPSRRFTPWRPTTAILLRAAILAGLLIAGWIGWRVLGPGASGAPGMAATSTAVAQRDTVMLPDGTTIVLAPASRIATLAWTDTVRSIQLSGEAFFSVERDPGRPFRVVAADASIEVLGTQFTVRNREAGRVTVAVREGRVTVSGATTGMTLEAGQVGRVSNGVAVLLDADSEAWLSWLDGVLEFDGEPLDNVAGELERWLGVSVRIADSSLAARRVTGRFGTTDASQVFEALSLTLEVAWAVRSGVYVLGENERK